MIGPLNHVGVAVPSIEEAVNTIKKSQNSKIKNRLAPVFVCNDRIKN